MKPEERVVKTYLESHYKLPIEYEPFKNDTINLPDFQLNGTIGVEVRRLNYNLENDKGDLVGLETVMVSLDRMIRSVFESYDSINEDGWYVNVYYQRNNGFPPLTRNELISTLNRFINEPIVNQTIHINEFITLKFKKRTPSSKKLFVLNQIRDRDRDGWFLSGFITNCSLVLTEKEDKVRPVINRYGEWWLVLVDYIYGSLTFDDYDKETILTHLSKSEVFKKIIIIEKSLTKEPFESFP